MDQAHAKVITMAMLFSKIAKKIKAYSILVLFLSACSQGAPLVGFCSEWTGPTQIVADPSLVKAYIHGLDSDPRAIVEVDIHSGQRLRTLVYPGIFLSMQLDPAASELWVASRDGSTLVFSRLPLASRKRATLRRFQIDVDSGAFTPGPRDFLGISRTGVAFAVDLTRQVILGKFELKHTPEVALAGPGLTFLSAGDGLQELNWETRSLESISLPGSERYFDAATSHDGSRVALRAGLASIAVVNMAARSVEVWGGGIAEDMDSLIASTTAGRMAMSPDGHAVYVAISSIGHPVRLFRITPEASTPVATIEFSEAVAPTFIESSGKLLLLVRKSGQDSLLVVDTANGYAIHAIAFGNKSKPKSCTEPA